MGEGVEYFAIEGRSVTETEQQRARRLVIAYAILLDALEHPYPDPKMDCSYTPRLFLCSESAAHHWIYDDWIRGS
jgi:hypothetical protein